MAVLGKTYKSPPRVWGVAAFLLGAVFTELLLLRHPRDHGGTAREPVKTATGAANRRRLLRDSAEEDLRPHFDVLYCMFSADGRKSEENRRMLRIIYDAYKGLISGVGADETAYSFTFKYFFLVRRPNAPPEGKFEGDIMYVNCADGYKHIAEKALRLMSVVSHFSFRVLFKGDEDTYACFNKIGAILHALPEVALSTLYMGVETRCNIARVADDRTFANVGKVNMNLRNKWYDPKFVKHTLGDMPCYPMYMQGGLYALGYSLAEHLYDGREELVWFANEDTTMGIWLHGKHRTVVEMNQVGDGSLWVCPCKQADWSVQNSSFAFYHRCNTVDKLRACAVTRGSGHRRYVC